MIEENIGRINGKHGNVDWQPIIYQYRHLSFTQLLTFYTACQVALVTPLRDGMNLVAKEFVASRADRKGVLVLSEMAGAANELEMAVIVNPTDIKKLKESIQQALEMSVKEQARRMMLMQEVVNENNIDNWLKTNSCTPMCSHLRLKIISSINTKALKNDCFYWIMTVH